MLRTFLLLADESGEAVGSVFLDKNYVTPIYIHVTYFTYVDDYLIEERLLCLSFCRVTNREKKEKIGWMLHRKSEREREEYLKEERENEREGEVEESDRKKKTLKSLGM